MKETTREPRLPARFERDPAEGGRETIEQALARMTVAQPETRGKIIPFPRKRPEPPAPGRRKAA